MQSSAWTCRRAAPDGAQRLGGHVCGGDALLAGARAPGEGEGPHPGAPVPGLRAGACPRNPQGSAFRGRLVPLSTVSSRTTRDGRAGEPPRCPGRAAPRRVAGPHLRTCPRVRDARLASTFGDRPCRGRGCLPYSICASSGGRCGKREPRGRFKCAEWSLEGLEAAAPGAVTSELASASSGPR